MKTPLKNPAKIRKHLLNGLTYFTVFMVVYLAINWWRQPIMPKKLNYQVTDYQAQTIDLVKMSYNKPTLIYFWGTWCGLCSVTTPKVNTLAEQGYSVVSIAVQSGDNSEIQQYMNEHNYHFTVINDDDGDMFFNDWQGKVTPSYVVFNDGEVTQGITGIQPLWSLKLRLWLSDIL